MKLCFGKSRGSMLGEARGQLGGWLAGLALLVGMAPVASALAVNEVETSASGSRTRIRMEVDVRTEMNKIDLLIVIDDSGSMSAHQANLARNVDRLTLAAAKLGADLHVGVLTTSADSMGAHVPGQLIGVKRAFASMADADFEATLRENLQKAMTTNGSGTEQPFASVLLSLQQPTRDGANKGFRRADAALAILLVTDADDQSAPLATIGQPGSSALISVGDFVGSLRSEVGPTGALALHAAFIPTNDTKCDRGGESVPTRIEAAMELIGGSRIANLCDPAFGDALEAVGMTMGQRVAREIQLPLPADYATMSLTYGSRQLMAGNLQFGFSFDRLRHRLILGERALMPLEPVGVPLIIEYWTK
ncbi:MAG TPA: hypothetical protein PLZ57_04640 [Pseudobdellovibrionaceae bacterium]|nr:hypothetical protein [Pseudobdellovibrionaceae bacterium]